MEDATPLKTTNTVEARVEQIVSKSLAPRPLPRLNSGPTLREEGGEALALAGIAHDARNLVTAMGLCAELISAPGVLAPKHGHLAGEMRSIAESSTQLVRRLTELMRRAAHQQSSGAAGPDAAIRDLSQSVQKMKSLLMAVAGPATEVELACLPCAGQLQLSEENLSRILVNLVRNATDAMPAGGHIRIAAQRGNGASFLWTLEGGQSPEYLWDDLPHPAGNGGETVLLTVEDSGPGIPSELLERVFDTGFSTHRGAVSWPESEHRGLGLSIVRELVESAGGTVRAVSSPLHGARLEIELPLTNVTSNLLSERRQDAPSDGQ